MNYLLILCKYTDIVFEMNITLYYFVWKLYQRLNTIGAVQNTMAGSNQNETITFKVDEAVKNAMKGIANRSDFIRSAILTALNNTCPLCHGSGILTPHQQKHWEDFTKHHPLIDCDQCKAGHFSCEFNHQEQHKEE